MKYRVLIVFLILLSACLFGLPLVRSFLEKPIVEEPISLSSEKLMQLVNEWRVEQGFQPYKINGALCRIAKERSREVVNDFSHDGFHEKFGNKQYPSTVAENLSAPGLAEKGTLYSWLRSKSHKDNLEKPYTYSCIATKDNFAVQIFSSCENGCP